MKLRIAATAAAVAAAAAIGIAAPANAATPAPQGKPAGAATAAASACAFPYLCLWYNSNEQGAYTLFFDAVPDFAGYSFDGAGAGQWQPVKNNAASATNWQTEIKARIYFNSNYGGVYDTIPESSSANLVKTYNENASFNWVN
ncbi:peptidase inhibitor family I36 protein [Streptomyces sp. NBC_00820]|uniref:peptidase inhibitor family I36 protein n=1 Tax=Streptomyces sp. NBC_00820 TaxID=2975842 RepID=UPI002ED39CAA|nr:peptidase inhibitor family I36 protein [Streptomyces sp. NBC_00820]